MATCVSGLVGHGYAVFDRRIRGYPSFAEKLKNGMENKSRYER